MTTIYRQNTMQTHYSLKPNDTLDSAYERLLEQELIKEDPYQLKVEKILFKLQTTLHNYTNRPSLLRRFLPQKSQKIKGIYLYGGVGRGKSMLMDLFFETTPLRRKRRVHFHAFMLEIHERLFLWRKQHHKSTQDPLPIIAKDIADQAALLCFDELQVTDIADAMILERLVTHLINQGVILVATSNRRPDDLYKDGLQRENFLPFIELIKNQMHVLHLDAPTDYRMQHLQSLVSTYVTPLGKDADKFLEQNFKDLTNNAVAEVAKLEIHGRTLTLEKTYGSIAWSSFEALCCQPLGANDYIEIAREFSTLLLADIPQLSAENRNEAKRFVTLIDQLYEHKVKLICTAEVAPESLYLEGTGHFEFQRTVSRLTEMQTNAYFKLPHLT